MKKQTRGNFLFIKKVEKLAKNFQDSYDKTRPFEDQAYSFLVNYDFFNIFSYEELINYSKTCEAERLKIYRNNEFGEYPVTIFRDEDFFIDVYIWDKKDTALHDHSFTGAFTILQGASLEIQYSFHTREENKFNNIVYGDIIRVQGGVLSQGDCRKIKLYDKFIHQVWHLENPTITLCLRTHFKKPFENLYHLSGFKGTYHQKDLLRLRSDLQKMNESQMDGMLQSLEDASLLWALSLIHGRSSKEFFCAKKALDILRNKFHLECGLTSQEKKFRAMKYLVRKEF